MILNYRLCCALMAGCAVLIPARLCMAQADDGLAARALYYNPGSDDASTQKKRVPARDMQRDTQPRAKTALAADRASGNTLSVPESSIADAKVKPVSAQTMTPVPHLGVKYNLVLVDEKGGEQAVDPAKVFHEGDCLSLRVEANYDGYLYVLQQGSSGKWEVLLPSTMMSEETNAVRAQTPSRIPANYCFAVDNSPGVEHVFVVLSRNAEDVYALNSAVRNRQSSPGSGAVAPAQQPDSRPATPVQEMALLHDRLQSRDLTIRKVAKPVAAGEAANTVYVVNATPTPSDRVVTEIPLRHE